MDKKELQALLFEAIQHHSDSLLNDLLDNEAGQSLIDQPCPETGNMLLHAAVIEEDFKCVEYLLKRGANPNVFDTNQARTPLHIAVELNRTEIVKAFLEIEHVNLGLRDDRNLTCFEIAQFCDNQNLADLIKVRQDEIDGLRNGYYTIINEACLNNDPNLLGEILNRFAQRTTDRLPKDWSPLNDPKLYAKSSTRQLVNWISSSSNDVTLLFKSAAKGYTEICKILIEHGATAKCNENTNHSALYVAAYGGFTETVKLLLDSFPYLISEVTIEKWTVLHACCLQGYWETAKLILTYPYPHELKKRFVDRSGVYEYDFAFDLNAQDAAGQTVVYLAVSANDEHLLDTLLFFKIEAKLVDQSLERDCTSRNSSSQRNQDNSIGSQNVSQNENTSSRDPDKGSQSKVERIISQLTRFNMRNEPVESAKESSSCQDKTDLGEGKFLICPFELDTYCDYNSKTALHLAVSKKMHPIASSLLVNGANPNLPILSRDSIRNESSSSNLDTGLNWLSSSKSTCLREASRQNDELMCDILIRYGASDNQDNLALQAAVANKNSRLVSKFLSLKGYVDREYKINKKCNVEFASRFRRPTQLVEFKSTDRNNSIGGTGGVVSTSTGFINNNSPTTTFSAMFPTIPVILDWQNLKCVRHIEAAWLVEASLLHNKKLKHPTTSLMAITRLDLSSNNLKSVPACIFRLPSLRELNLSRNRLESLPTVVGRQLSSSTHPGDPNSSTKANECEVAEAAGIHSTSKLIKSHQTAMKRSKSSQLSSVGLESSNRIRLDEAQEWDLPSLEQLDLHDNRLMALPDCLFELPHLRDLDVSSNQIRQLPWSVWRAPALRELSASGNLLDELPRVAPLETEAPWRRRGSKTEAPINEESFGSAGSLSTSSSGVTDESNCFDGPTNNSSFVDQDCGWLSPTSGGDMDEDQDPNTGSSSGGVTGRTWSKLNQLNLSHNSFLTIPPVLACVAGELVRLNLSHNRLESLGDIGLYPTSLKSLDVNHNKLVNMFQPVVGDCDTHHCYGAPIEWAEDASGRFKNDIEVQSDGEDLAPGRCPHKLHSQLEQLRSLNLSHNQLSEIRIDSPNSSSTSQADQTNGNKQELWFPSLTSLDLSYNQLSQVPSSLSELRDLSVLNLGGNSQLSSLPPELGLLSKLWNLGLADCGHLSKPLKSMVADNKSGYKTVEVVRYLRSILEDAKPYARMKLMLVGLQGIGKTSLLEQLRQEPGSSSGGGGSGGIASSPPEHWTKRMGHSRASGLRNQRGTTLSTVGVDIHEWQFCKRVPRGEQTYGPVTFSTWDFGGQREFYATHRYFLSRRSLYLAVWRLTDGLEGIQSLQQWLVNIHSRAAGSPVLLVGTHVDLMEGGESGEEIRRLQAEVSRRFLQVADHDKLGLPRIVDSLVVSTRSRHNIRLLCNRIYDVAFSLKASGSGERLLEQRIPATYLYLEEIVHSIAQERRKARREPVLSYQEFRHAACEQMHRKHQKQFRDLEPVGARDINHNSELQQAVRFLHENGTLLHYEDANLRDLYFLDPQWLCDVLSQVVSVCEINPNVRNGLMRIADLGHLLKSVAVDPEGGIAQYVLGLLNKFEVALTWNSEYLLIPSLLPDDPMAVSSAPEMRIRGRSVARPSLTVQRNLRRPPRPTSVGLEPVSEPDSPSSPSQPPTDTHQVESGVQTVGFKLIHEGSETINRLLVLRYLPAGFLARLQSEVLSNTQFDEVCSELQQTLVEQSGDHQLADSLGSQAGWLAWRTGIRLSLQHETSINSTSVALGPTTSSLSVSKPVNLLTIEEIGAKCRELKLDQLQVECVHTNLLDQNYNDQSAGHTSRLELASAGWTQALEVDQGLSVLLISVPRWKLISTGDKDWSAEPPPRLLARLLAICVDHIDNLLEDWYPSLGARFAHTLGGSYLVSRLVPCPGCFGSGSTGQTGSGRSSRSQVKFSIGSATRGSRWNAPGSRDNSGQSVNRIDDIISPTETRKGANQNQQQVIHCFYVEHCILIGYNIFAASASGHSPSNSANSSSGTLGFRRLFNVGSSSSRVVSNAHQLQVICPKHSAQLITKIAPDILFEDLTESQRINSSRLERCKLIGRGTFGFVFRGSLKPPETTKSTGQQHQEVALKLLQLVEPGPDADSTDLAAFKAARVNWCREPFQSACKSYCTARHEVNIIRSLRHPNIVEFQGLCVRPLGIVLELAPLGCLSDVFKAYKRSALRIDPQTVRCSLQQVARALAYLHEHRIIYRDLKSENVLVWRFPSPFATRRLDSTAGSKLVELKLADYGISRQALSAGICKGFAGTISFLAPEILRHNGDEEYTEKVDCFSFGMFIFELLTLRPAFKRNDGVKGNLLDGARPQVTAADRRSYPSYMFDLMFSCWSQEPQHRPTAAEIIAIAGSWPLSSE